MKVFTGIYITLSLIAAVAVAAVLLAVGFVPAVVPYEFLVKFLLTVGGGILGLFILVGAIAGALAGERNSRTITVGAGAISCVLIIAATVVAWYIFWVNPSARAEFEKVTKTDAYFAEELVSGQLDDAYDLVDEEPGYFAYRLGLWSGVNYSIYGYRGGAPINLHINRYPDADWNVNVLGAVPVPAASVKYLSITSYQIRAADNGALEVEGPRPGEWVPLSAVSAYLANDPRASAAVRGILDSNVDFSVSNGVPSLNYHVPGEPRPDAAAERERLSRLLDFIADIYPPGVKYDWNPEDAACYTR